MKVGDQNVLSEEPPGSQLNPSGTELTIYLYNVVEDEWNFINAYSDPVHILKDIERDESTSDCFFLATATQSDFVYICPKPISSEFQAYAQNLLKYKNGYILSPRMTTHQLCLDLINDQTTFKQLLTIAQNYQKVSLTSYVASSPFYKLKELLVKKGLNLSTPEAPELENAWTVNFFGSKSGIRQLAQKSVAAEPDFIMPDGIICMGKTDAAKIAAHKYLKQKGVVIKTNKGCGGGGVLIFRENDLPNTYLSCQRKLEDIFNQELYWEKFPIVVEDLVNVNYAMAGGFPNLEFKIKKNGAIDLLFHGILLVTPQGEYYGMEVNEDILPDRLLTRIIDTGYFIAEQYASAGYRGHFDVDMIIAKNNQVYVSESNTRNTGWTDIYKVVRKLIGPDFLHDAYSLSQSRFKLQKGQYSRFPELLQKLEPLLFSPQTKQGIIINSENIIQEKELIYTVIGKDKKTAYSIQDELKKLLENGQPDHLPTTSVI